MVVKNTGRKIISFGQTTVLPGATAQIDDTFKGDSTVKAFIALGYIEEVGGKSAEKTDKPKKGGKGKPETPDAEPTGEPTSEGAGE